MADVKESAMSAASDCKWVRALDANGNSIRISKEDLASVVGGLLEIIVFGGEIDAENKTVLQAKQDIVNKVIEIYAKIKDGYKSRLIINIRVNNGAYLISNFGSNENIITAGPPCSILINNIYTSSGNAYFTYEINSYGISSCVKGVVVKSVWGNYVKTNYTESAS